MFRSISTTGNLEHKNLVLDKGRGSYIECVRLHVLILVAR